MLDFCFIQTCMKEIKAINKCFCLLKSYQDVFLFISILDFMFLLLVYLKSKMVTIIHIFL